MPNPAVWRALSQIGEGPSLLRCRVLDHIGGGIVCRVDPDLWGYRSLDFRTGEMRAVRRRVNMADIAAAAGALAR